MKDGKGEKATGYCTSRLAWSFYNKLKHGHGADPLRMLGPGSMPSDKMMVTACRSVRFFDKRPFQPSKVFNRPPQSSVVRSRAYDN